MKIFIGADHRGYELKKEIVKLLNELGHEVFDVGTHQKAKMCDYPKISFQVARQVVQTKNSKGILVCLTGIGHVIAANKIKGAYAALCYSKEAAILSREHNNSNILVLGSNFVSVKELKEIIEVWLDTKFLKGRHLRRVRQIKTLEKEIYLKGKSYHQKME